MTNDLIDTCTDALRELHIIERTRVGISVDTRLVTDGVQLLRRYPGFDMGCRDIEDFTGQLCGRGASVWAS